MSGQYNALRTLSTLTEAVRFRATICGPSFEAHITRPDVRAYLEFSA